MMQPVLREPIVSHLDMSLKMVLNLSRYISRRIGVTLSGNL